MLVRPSTLPCSVRLAGCRVGFRPTTWPLFYCSKCSFFASATLVTQTRVGNLPSEFLVIRRQNHGTLVLICLHGPGSSPPVTPRPYIWVSEVVWHYLLRLTLLFHIKVLSVAWNVVPDWTDIWIRSNILFLSRFALKLNPVLTEKPESITMRVLRVFDENNMHI